jgi:hypothetical protein
MAGAVVVDKSFHFLHPRLQFGDAEVRLVKLFVAFVVAGSRKGNILQSVDALFVSVDHVGQILDSLPRWSRVRAHGLRVPSVGSP